MELETRALQVSGDYEVVAYKWDIRRPKGVIQLIHGSLEHCGRYEELARLFNRWGYVVVGNDHRGHGLTAQHNGEILGHIGHKANHETIIKDLLEVNKFIKTTYPELPIILFGHSWGSFLARCLMGIETTEFQGAILSGTGWETSIKTNVALASLQTAKLFRFGNDTKTSQLIAKHSFQKFNNNITDQPKTGLEWCSNVLKEQKKFNKDPLRGREFSIAGFRGLIGSVKAACSPSTIEQTPTSNPILIVSGAEDPVGNMGKGVNKFEEKLLQAGAQCITKNIYPGQRHELHHDTGKSAYFKDIMWWLTKYFK